MGINPKFKLGQSVFFMHRDKVYNECVTMIDIHCTNTNTQIMYHIKLSEIDHKTMNNKIQSLEESLIFETKEELLKSL